MATKEISSVEWTCDGCGSTQLVPADAPPPNGFHFPLAEVWADGKRIAHAREEVWACKKTCIRNAVERSLWSECVADEETDHD